MSRCFVTNFDDNYMPYAAVMLQSLADNYKNPLDVICLVSPGLVGTQEEEDFIDKLKDTNLNIEFRSSDKYSDLIQKFNAEERFWSHITNIAMEKLYIGSICNEYDEAVYVDADCLFVGDATKFIEHPLYGKKIVAYSEDIEVVAEDLNLPERAYFNNGVFIADLNYWRDASLEERMTDWILNNETGKCIEQSAMNMFLYEEWFPLSAHFNYNNHSLSRPKRIKNPALIHFIGPVKPWNDNTDYDPERGKYDLAWRKVYDKVWGIETFWRPHLEELEEGPSAKPYEPDPNGRIFE